MRSLFLSSLVLMTLNVFSQVTPAKQPAPPMPPAKFERPEFIMVVQMGTDTMKNIEDTVKIEKQVAKQMKHGMMSPNYIVMLTPVGDCRQLNLIKTDSSYFIVRQQKGSEKSKGIFNYVVYSKRTRPQMPMHSVPIPPQKPMAPKQQTPPPPPKQQ